MNNTGKDKSLIHFLRGFLPEEEIARVDKNFEESPNRITKAYSELFSAYSTPSASDILKVTKKKEDKYLGIVSGNAIPFLSFCEHHFLPFTGYIDLFYKPGENILGIGKLARLVDYRTKRFIIQEDIARYICEDLINYGGAKAAFCRVVARHMCLCYRGPKRYNSKNTVTYCSGEFSKIEFDQIHSQITS